MVDESKHTTIGPLRSGHIVSGEASIVAWEELAELARKSGITPYWLCVCTDAAE
jgi:hypothetical protein